MNSSELALVSVSNWWPKRDCSADLDAKILLLGLPWELNCEESVCNSGATGDEGSIPRSGKSPGEGHSNPPQHSCLDNPMDRGAQRAIVPKAGKSQTWLKWFSMHTRLLSLPHHFLKTEVILWQYVL